MEEDGKWVERRKANRCEGEKEVRSIHDNSNNCDSDLDVLSTSSGLRGWERVVDRSRIRNPKMEVTCLAGGEKGKEK